MQIQVYILYVRQDGSGGKLLEGRLQAPGGPYPECHYEEGPATAESAGPSNQKLFIFYLQTQACYSHPSELIQPGLILSQCEMLAHVLQSWQRAMPTHTTCRHYNCKGQHTRCRRFRVLRKSISKIKEGSKVETPNKVVQCNRDNVRRVCVQQLLRPRPRRRSKEYKISSALTCLSQNTKREGTNLYISIDLATQNYSTTYIYTYIHIYIHTYKHKYT